MSITFWTIVKNYFLTKVLWEHHSIENFEHGEKISISFPVVCRNFKSENNYTRNYYSKLTPNYDPPSYTSGDEEEEEEN